MSETHGRPTERNMGGAVIPKYCKWALYYVRSERVRVRGRHVKSYLSSLHSFVIFNLV